ncbi:hypothetical protein Forpe1208_v003805 [Fusarium oxysporum f. sp. rapae]|uniref:Epidermal growth factor receptor-like transmembrane-juxtamembrane segment domain-containing protein n=1 Tax=Fusarium oxysporum f. sp. rapae TaxID=485398 RepID=A0A8J5UEF3_FUSOX|nr:hypothetical protein Forpe1208_v003805 [Fusarium oxysporum f. sp. rapae]
MILSARSSCGFLIATALYPIYAINIGHKAETRHIPDEPARITEAPLGVIDPLNLLLGNGPGLKPRAESEDSALAVTIAPDETCGYVTADKDSPVTCPSSRLCSWAVSSGLGLVACGSQIHITCLESSKAVNSTRCDDVCQSNTFNLLCTNSDRPFCRTYVYPSGIFDYKCASTTVDELEHVYFTFEGQKNQNLSTVTLTDEASEGLGEPVTVTVQGKATGSPSAVTIYMIPQPPSESTTSSDSSGSSGKSTPVGAIVGGVVGGVAVLGLIGLGVFCLLRRRKKNKRQEYMAGQPNMAHPINQNQHPYHPQHGAVPPYTDPSMASPAPLDARMSMMTGSVSPGGQNAHGGGSQLSPSMVQTPAPAYEMAGSEAREPEPVYEMGVDSPGRK